MTENAWVQITAADGTVIYENIMLPGEEFVVPQLELPPNSEQGCLVTFTSLLMENYLVLLAVVHQLEKY